jgi:predicted nucleic acid-binding protein
VNSRVGDVFFDANTLMNFAIVNRLDLLEVHYGWRAQWTETVRDEVQRGVAAVSSYQQILDASWLPDPLEIQGTSMDDLHGVDALRRALGGLPANPTQHLGEAELIYYLERRRPDGIFITDDRPARDLATRRQLLAIDTATVLSECYSYGEVGCPEAYDLLVQMADLGRGVRVPASHTLVCP